MHYAYPTGLTPDVIQAIHETPNVLPYLDLPLQHSHPEILRAMNRPWHGRVNDDVIDRIKSALPEAVLRTTFIVGFPGETEEHFQHLMQFVRQHQFDHVGVFSFSPEEGTLAYRLSNQVPLEIREQRREQLMLAQQPISWQRNQGEIGNVVEVLVEQEHPDGGRCIGRSSRFAPEVDGLVYLEGHAPLNQLVPVKITAADTYDLFGHVVATQQVA
jgi:ribosomal protein S12 methylthiotransferase